MDTHDMLVELLAIKLYELDGGLYWHATDPLDRQLYRALIVEAVTPDDAYKDMK